MFFRSRQEAESINDVTNFAPCVAQMTIKSSVRVQEGWCQSLSLVLFYCRLFCSLLMFLSERQVDVNKNITTEQRVYMLVIHR